METGDAAHIDSLGVHVAGEKIVITVYLSNKENITFDLSKSSSERLIDALKRAVAQLTQ